MSHDFLKQLVFFLYPPSKFILKKEEKISYQKRIFPLLQFALFNTKSALKMKEVGSSWGQHAYVRGLGRPMLFLRAKRTHSRPFSGYIFVAGVQIRLCTPFVPVCVKEETLAASMQIYFFSSFSLF